MCSRDLREDAVGIKSLEREHSGIPSCGDEGYLVSALGSLVDCLEVLGDLSVCIETVDNVVKSCVLGCCYGKIRSGTAAVDHDIEVSSLVLEIVNGVDGNACCSDLKGSRVASCEYALELHVGAS